MSRFAACFSALKSSGRKALIPYVTAGDSNPAMTVPLMHAMVDAGADIIELGVPFSDPMADGPVIQAACERALVHHVSLHDVLGMVAEFRKTNDTTPVVLMGYLNPIEVMGYTAFAQSAAEAGVDGALTVDMPPEEADELVAALKARAIDTIFLLSPTSTPERIRLIASQANGFLYYVSFKGVTGANRLDVNAVAKSVDAIRAVTDIPVGVGFGIRDASSAAAVAAVADAVVVGSALVKEIAVAENVDTAIARISEVLSGMRQAMDAQPQAAVGNE